MHVRFLLTYLVFGLVFICSSCAYKQDQILFEHKNAPPDSVLQRNAANIPNYRIKAQDILQIRNLQNNKSIIDTKPPEDITDVRQTTTSLADSYQVDEDGTIPLTGLGHVEVAGLTRQEATKKLEDLYLEKFVKEIILEVKITNLNVTMLGEVRAQGNYPLPKDKTSLIELIGLAGGLTDKADEKDIKIIRGKAQNTVEMYVDIGDMKSISNPLIMQSGDVVYVAKNKRTIRAEKNEGLSILVQPVLIIFSTLALIYTLAKH